MKPEDIWGPEFAAALDLLAVLHRDGGHHTYEVGFIQSCKDAADKCLPLLQKEDHPNA